MTRVGKEAPRRTIAKEEKRERSRPGQDYQWVGWPCGAPPLLPPAEKSEVKGLGHKLALDLLPSLLISPSSHPLREEEKDDEYEEGRESIA